MSSKEFYCENRLEAISRRIDGDLAGAEELERHLEECDGCRRLDDLIRDLRQDLSGGELLPPGLDGRILGRLRAEGFVAGGEPGFGRRLLGMVRSPLPALAATLLVVAAATLVLTEDHQVLLPPEMPASADSTDDGRPVGRQPGVEVSSQPSSTTVVGQVEPAEPPAAGERRQLVAVPESDQVVVSTEKAEAPPRQEERQLVPAPAVRPAPTLQERRTSAPSEPTDNVLRQAAREAEVRAEAWQPQGGADWDRPPVWTPEARRWIERIRGGRVSLRIEFSAEGKILSADVRGGDPVRGRRLVQMLRALDRAVVPPQRGGVMVAGSGRVEMGAAGL